LLPLLLIFFVSYPARGARVYRDEVDPHWFANQTKFWYRVETGPGKHEFVLVDAEGETRQPAFDHARLAAALSKQLGHPVASDRLPIDELKFDDNPPAVEFLAEGSRWRLETPDYTLTKSREEEVALRTGDQPHPSKSGGRETQVIFEDRTEGPIELYWLTPSGEQKFYAVVLPGKSRAQHTYVGHVWLVTDPAGKQLGVFEAIDEQTRAVIDGKPGPRTPPAATQVSRRRPKTSGPRSPDGKWVAFIKEDALLARRASGGKEYAIGSAKQGQEYSESQLWWSPDSQNLVAICTEAAQEHKIYTVESSPPDQVQPKLRVLDYLKPGDRIDHPHVELFHIDDQSRVPVTDELFSNPWSIQDVRWAADSSRFTFVYNQRGHQALRVIEVDARSGTARAIVDEHSDTFIDYSGKFFCQWIGDDELIWMSERDGWNHLWLYDAKAGKVRNPITSGDWPVQRVIHVDEAKRQVWFAAGGVRPGQDPYFTHFCRINFDGSEFIVLTEGDGNHKIRWSPGNPFFIDSFSRVDLPPLTQLRSSGNGKLVCKLEEADASEALAERNGRWPERFVAKGRDGATDIYGIILWPRDFDASKMYPIVEQVYAGPQDFYVPKAFRANYGKMQQIADRGMIVVQADGMGTSGRSKTFHDVCWKNLKDAGFADRIAWIKAAAAAHPQMDLSRVGIYGGSAGGQNALGALLWHHDFYKVAVADCGCHDNRMDKIWWNEQWMGWPVDKSYEESSNVVNAHLLEGKLMLVVGEMDDNVDPSSTMQVVNALEKANKDFELVVVTGAHHGSAETPYGSKRRMEFLTRNLLGNAN
jgi:dipeptidyl aminopeptidase/acylaminoacyl peptidase